MNLITNNKIVQSLWIGDNLSKLEQLSIQSFLSNGHLYHLYVYDEIANIPDGTSVFDANEIIPKNQIFVYKDGWAKGSYSGFADLFRIKLLKLKGGWWVDSDIVCLKFFNFDSDTVIASSFEGTYGELAISCVLKFPSQSHVLDYLLDFIKKTDLNNLKFIEIGPHLLQKSVRDLSLDKYVVNYQVFCPIVWRAVKEKIVFQKYSYDLNNIKNIIKDLLRPIMKKQTMKGRLSSKTHAVHLWNEIWRQSNIDKNQTFHKNCLFEKLKRKYQI